MCNRFCRGAWTAALLLVAIPPAFADPVPVELIPPPRAYAPAPVVIPRPVYYYVYPRVSRYEVWQNLGVDRFGRFRPLVIDSPYGAYYRYNGRPFPWTVTHDWEYESTVLSPPSR